MMMTLIIKQWWHDTNNDNIDIMQRKKQFLTNNNNMDIVQKIIKNKKKIKIKTTTLANNITQNLNIQKEHRIK